jgi:CHAT domain-containing protein/Tfp pilus assembly protein PilF
MHAIAKCSCCLFVLATTLWPQIVVAPPTQAPELLAKGKQLYTQEGPKAALQPFQEALKIFRLNGDRHGEAITLGYVANCQRKLGNLDQALELAQQALRMKQDLGDRGEIGNTQNQLGLIYWERSDYPNAIQHLNDAIEIASAVGDKELEGAARNNLGLVFDERGDYSHSLQEYKRALELHRASHFERGEGDTLGNIGGIYLLLGKFSEALPYYRQALEISERLGLKPASSDDFGDIALCQAGIGDIDAALTSFDHAAQIAREAGLAKEEADWHKGKGTTLAGLGRYDAALREYAAAEQAYKRSGLQRELVEALIDTAMVYESLGDIPAAELRFQHGLRLAKKIGSAAGESASTLALGDLERRRRNNELADRYFGLALARATAAGDEGTIVAALLQRGRNEIDLKRYGEALKNVTQATEIADRLANRPAMAQSRYVLGEVQRSRAEFDKALEQYAVAENLQRQIRDPELGWRVLYGRGQALEAEGETADAINAYKSAIDIIEETRSQISEERYRAGYIEDRYQVYVTLVELLLKLRNPEDAFFYSEKLRARAYFDQLGPTASAGTDSDAQRHFRELEQQIRSLRHAIEKEYTAPEKDRRGQALDLYSAELELAEREYQELLDNTRNSNRDASVRTQSIPSVSEIQRALPPETALIEFVVGKQSLSTLFISSNSVVGIPIRVSSESLSSRTELLRGLIMQRSPQWIHPAKGIFQVLFAPLNAAGQLSQHRQLLIVPDGVLNYLPFAALPNPDNRFLGDVYNIAYLPSAAGLLAGSLGSSSGRKLLAMAPSGPQLPNTAAEARSIGKIFSGNSRVVFGKAATETLFKQVAGNYDYLHLATHGSLNRNAPSLSALQLEPDAKNDGRLELHEIAAMKLHARLVTLSACETALGKGYFTETPAGDEFVGMTRAFIGAGSHSVLASLWAVDDESTRILMVRFYRHLLLTGSAEALAQAQREIRHSDPRYRHPYYWAPFVMVGSIN